MEGVAAAMDHGDLRIGDAERERTMAALREHFAQGRLTHEELDERLDRALAARTGRDLATITADLPGQERGHAEPGSPHTMDSWHAAMHEQREQMRAMAHRHRDLHRARSGHPGRRHRHGPVPFIPLLVLAMVAMVVIGGGGLFKVLFFVVLGAMVFSLIKKIGRRR